ncbi:hypothetical protein DFJ58DRAFT_797197 [Suillus subalutaceus]|uniref:uncharacterized protein n=1 Tax=Suillus subalutaceus TaxID=48586 RepID=UPI001B87C7D7|nr:uncharacterized protein DFJ58DRAFT_797197 [Suillus subalutaceus]KAG1847877.1 hypothetical protein DFJ58DRAFT_797197 [Suillus subalutaceus]
MRLCFQVVLAVVAALTVSMAVSAESECHSDDHLCNTDKDCCNDSVCVAVFDPHVDEVSFSSLIQDLLTHPYGSLTTNLDVSRTNELQ